MTTLAQIVAERPYPDYLPWWGMGERFLSFMAEAITAEWAAVVGEAADVNVAQQYAADYISLVYGQVADGRLAERFVQKAFAEPVRSGEFDALSYAFYRHAFEGLAVQYADDAEQLGGERLAFTQRVGARFFAAVYDHLQLDLPRGLETAAQFAQLQENIGQVGVFLQEEGYLRDHFAFTFGVDVVHGGRPVQQEAADFVTHIAQNGVGYALYEMGYPAILPSAVYLYHTMGEAQHHSSRTIEELFARVGFAARETDDFDPTGFPSERVVELWEIRPRG